MTPMSTISVKGPECWKLLEASTRFSGDSLHALIQSCSCARGYGVSVHRVDCPNAAPERRSKADEGRWLRVSWAETTQEAYRTTLQVTGKDRMGLLVDISTVLSSTKTRVSSLNARSTPDGFALIDIETEVADHTQLQAVIRRLEQISGVMRVTRPAG